MKTSAYSTLALSAACLVLSACGSGTPSDRDDVAVQAPVSATKLTLSGIVTDNPIVNASVEMRVGDVAFASKVPTGSSGDFRLDIESQDSDALIMAQADDMVNGVRLCAVLDTFENLQARASNGMVDGVRITNVTTAQQVLAERLALDGSVDSFVEYLELAPQIDAEELLELSAALKVVIENIDGNTLPSGFSDTVAFARAIAAGELPFVSDLALTSPDALTTARNRLLTDGNATVPFRAADVPGVYMASGASDFAYALFSNGTAVAEFFEDEMVPGTPSWSLDAHGMMTVQYYGYELATDRISSIGRVGDTLHIVTDATAAESGAVTRRASNVAHYAFGAGFEATDVAGTWANPDAPNSQWVFDAGGTGYTQNATTMAVGQTFSWDVDGAGVLVLTFDDSNNRVEIHTLEADGDNAPNALTINRYAGQGATLSVGGWARTSAT